MLFILSSAPSLGKSAKQVTHALRAKHRMTSTASIQRKNVAVIGANRGIGLELARQLLARGNSVYATARKPIEAKELQQLKSEQLSISALDVSIPDAIREWAGQLKGQEKFDYVFNVAGVTDTTRSGLKTIDAEKMLHCFKTNTIGTLLVVQQLLENGLIGSGSTVANLTSKMGSIADNSSGSSYAYRASKTALNQVTKSLSVDLEGQGITCVLLHPGWVRTDITKGKGLIDVEECVSGLISVLENDRPLNGRWYDYKHEQIPF